MRTVEEVTAFIENILPIDVYFPGWGKNVRKNIEHMVNQVPENENIVFAFPYASCNADLNGCLLVTDKRIFYGSGIKSLLYTPHQKSVDIKDINDVSLNYQDKVSIGFFNTLNNQSQVVIDTIREKIVVSFYHQGKKVTDPVQKIHDAGLETLLFDLKEKRNQPQVVVQGGGLSAADEIKKYKALMEEGIITEEEFNAKKKQLLGL